MGYGYSASATGDAQAMADARDYLGETRWAIIEDLLRDPKQSIDRLDFYLGFAGVSGYPFHALMRHYRLEEYREWMHSGDDGIMTDERGFPLD